MGHRGDVGVGVDAGSVSQRWRHGRVRTAPDTAAADSAPLVAVSGTRHLAAADGRTPPPLIPGCPEWGGEGQRS